MCAYNTRVRIISKRPRRSLGKRTDRDRNYCHSFHLDCLFSTTCSFSPFSLLLHLITRSLILSLSLPPSLSLTMFSERRQNLNNNNNNIETFPFGARKTIAAQQHDNNITASHIIYICIRVIIILRICLRNVTRMLIAAAYSLNTRRFSGRVILLKLLWVFPSVLCVCVCVWAEEGLFRHLNRVCCFEGAKKTNNGKPNDFS